MIDDVICRLDPGYVKAYYRRGSANYAMGKLKEAKADFRAVLRIVPGDPESTKKFKACEKALKQRAFAAALEVEHAPPITDKEVNEIVVDEKYSGPRLPEEGAAGITVDFVQELMSYFFDQRLLHRKYVLQILLAARAHFESLPSLLRLSLPPGPGTHFNVCGDTHGQFYDLLHIFQVGGVPSPENPYLFNGDFVDRGSFSLETVLTLLAWKLAAPAALFMLRGNHESKNMNEIYGFAGEVRHKYDDAVMRLFTEVFNWLPVAAVLQDSVFVVHGGLSSADDGQVSLQMIEDLPRNREPPEGGLMSDLLWSDPHPGLGRQPSKRGLGFSFGSDITDRFLKLNHLSLVVRSHEVKDEGYVVEHEGKCITVFSAPNYCDQMGNKGAFIRFKDDLKPAFTQFAAAPHPNIPPMRYAANIFGL